MKLFVARNILIGIAVKPSYKDYWSSTFELRDAFTSTLMSRGRFSWLLGNIHIHNNVLQPTREKPEFNKLYKIHPLLNALGRSFIECCNPAEYQSLDESWLKFKCRLMLLQYMPLNPIKRAYKIWMHVDKYGYVCQFQICTGKVSNATENNLGPRVIKDLTKGIGN
ncbi:hypothetical protein ILUMI_20307 [Ignelater luminosus]|uniref:PiggyBac transposable element-derived protein domain-containing protein n=1 Tax=Ignelater luminosus TaxID=2038154 RepID=A0A8K0CL58_IGNLU|nr:hypothetical protein ILUMI_20307 [Ignelater luminosus]